MSAIRSKDTTPEMIVRRMVYAMGFRYRLHRKNLPGKPDMVFIGKRKIIDAWGCYWHAHVRLDPGCLEARSEAKSIRAYWGPKMDRNVQRDADNLARLEADGWQVLIVWECNLRDMPSVEKRVREFLA